MSQATCNFPGCTRAVHADGLCAFHASQAVFDENVAKHRTSRASLGRMDKSRAAPDGPAGNPSCRVAGCERKVKARGLCVKHYHLLNDRGQQGDAVRAAALPSQQGRGGGRKRAQPEGLCRVEGCPRKGLKRGLCNRHYILLHEPGEGGDVARAAALPSRQGQGGGRKTDGAKPRRGRRPRIAKAVSPPSSPPSSKGLDVQESIRLLAERLGLGCFRQEDRLIVLSGAHLASVDARGEVRRCEIRELET